MHKSRVKAEKMLKYTSIANRAQVIKKGGFASRNTLQMINDNTTFDAFKAFSMNKVKLNLRQPVTRDIKPKTGGQFFNQRPKT